MRLYPLFPALAIALLFASAAEAQRVSPATPQYAQAAQVAPVAPVAPTPAEPGTPASGGPEGVRVLPALPVTPVVTPDLHDQKADINDIAQFIAGLPVLTGPLATLEQQPEWIAYSNSINPRWAAFDAHRLQPIRSWTATELAHASAGRVFYPFSGPDAIYVTTMFPNASTYILCGLEPVGDVPTLGKLQPLGAALGWLQASLKTLIDAGYFVTKDMRVELKMSPLQGCLPLICVMLAREGYRITSITANATHAEIHFVTAIGGPEKSLFYFSADLSNAGMGKGSAFRNFLEKVHPDAAYVKSASYLMHEDGFSAVRSFLLTQCSTIVQDDSGIPLRYFDARRWSLRLYGAYTAPLNIFAKYYQKDLADLYAKTSTTPLTFGAGYHWDPKTATLIVATAHQ